MKLKTPTYLLLLLCSFFMSCDYESIIEFEIDNQSDSSLNIETDYTLFPKDTNYISGQTKLTILISETIGATTTKRMNNLETLPFDEILITNTEGKTFQPDPLEKDNWEAIYPEKRDGLTGIFKLVVKPEDFE